MEPDSERGTAVVSNDRRRGLGKGLGALIPTTPTDILSERTRTDAAAAVPAPAADLVSRETSAVAVLTAPAPTSPALGALPIDQVPAAPAPAAAPPVRTAPSVPAPAV